MARLFDFILNVAGLLLWLNWRAFRLDVFTRGTPSALAGTVRRAESMRWRRWHYLAALGGLLVIRALFYWQAGPALKWVPTLDLVFVAPDFRQDFFGSALLYSGLSFLRALMVLLFWLLFLSVINRRLRENDPIQNQIQAQLGRVGRWPGPLQLILPIVAIAALWLLLHPLLVRTGIMPRAQSWVHVLEQGALTGAAVYFSLKFLLPAFFLAHLIASYVYLGKNPFWGFVHATARNLLAPLNRLPLRAGKLDFAPLLGIVLVVLGLHFVPEWVRTEMFRRGITLWPQ